MRRGFLPGSAMRCLLLALLVPGAVAVSSRSLSPAPPRPAPRVPAGGAGREGEGTFLTRFGKRYLKGTDVVAEVDVARVSRVGCAVEVASLVPRRILFDRRPPAFRHGKGLLVLGNRGDFVAGTRFLLFLKRYGSGMMYSVRERLPFLDENYKEKMRLIEAYIGIERIPDPGARRKALKELLLEGVADRFEWIRWNALFELEDLVEEGKASFDRADMGRIAAVEKKKISPSYRKRLDKVLDAIRASREEEERDGGKGRGGKQGKELEKREETKNDVPLF